MNHLFFRQYQYMGKHNKQKRKEYLKPSRRQLKEKKNAMELPSGIRAEISERIQVDDTPFSPNSLQDINLE